MFEMVVILAVWRLYLLGVAILAANTVSRLFFRPSKKTLISTFKSLGLLFVWPLALVSPEGRKILFNVKI